MKNGQECVRHREGKREQVFEESLPFVSIVLVSVWRYEKRLASHQISNGNKNERNGTMITTTLASLSAAQQAGKAEPDPDALAMSDAAAITVEYARVRETRRNDESPTATTPRLGALQYQCLDIYSLPLTLDVIPSGQDTHNNIAVISTGN